MTVTIHSWVQSRKTVERFLRAAEPKRGVSLDGCHVQESHCDMKSVRERASYYLMMMMMMMIKCLT